MAVQWQLRLCSFVGKKSKAEKLKSEIGKAENRGWGVLRNVSSAILELGPFYLELPENGSSRVNSSTCLKSSVFLVMSTAFQVRVEKIAHSLIPFGSNLPLPADWIFSDSQFAQLSLDCLPIGALGLRWSKQCDQHVCLGRQIFKFGAFDSPRFDFGFDGRVGFHG